MKHYLPLAWLILLHTLVDGFAIVIEPLWPRFGETFHLSSQGIALLMTLWAISTSSSQVLFGYLGDRYGTPYLLTLGPLVTVGSISAIGLAPSAAALGVLLVLGGFAVGSFHPEGAVTAAGFRPENSTRGLALFMCGGTLGLGIGPVLGGWLVHHYGLPSLTWLAPPVVLVILAIGWRARNRRRLRPATKANEQEEGRRERSRPSDPPTLAEVFRGRVAYALLLLAASAMAVVPGAGMGRALAYTLHAAGRGEDAIGMAQGVFLFSGGVGMLLCALLLRRDAEKQVMLVCPILGIPLLILVASLAHSYGVLLPLLVPTGMIVTGSTPAIVSYAHRLLPRGRGLATSMTMGVSWGISGAITAALVAHFHAAGTPQRAIAAFAPCLALSWLAAVCLPNPGRETSAASDATVEARAAAPRALEGADVG